MRTIRSFPDRYPLVNEQVAEIALYHALSREDVRPEDLHYIEQMEAEGLAKFEYGGGAEFHVVLKDGRCFQFSSYTPERLRHLMDRDGRLSYVDIGLIILSESSMDAILEALEEVLQKGQVYRALEHFGFPCGDENDKEA